MRRVQPIRWRSRCAVDAEIEFVKRELAGLVCIREIDIAVLEEALRDQQILGFITVKRRRLDEIHAIRAVNQSEDSEDGQSDPRVSQSLETGQALTQIRPQRDKKAHRPRRRG